MQPANDIYRNLEIYGFCGQPGVNRRRVARQLNLKSPLCPSMFIAFSDQIKLQCASENNIPIEQFDSKTVETQAMLQTTGLNERSRVPRVWIEFLDATIRMHAARGIRRFIITDVKFQNELEWCRSIGGFMVGVDADVTQPTTDIITQCDVIVNETSNVDEILNARDGFRGEYRRHYEIHLNGTQCAITFGVLTMSVLAYRWFM